MTLSVTWFTDPACPWAYSAHPALAVLRWRYADQLSWRLVTIGLIEEDDIERVAKMYTPARAATGWITFRSRYGMPFAFAGRERTTSTSRACRTIVATRMLSPAHEYAVHRTLALAWFTTGLMLDRDEDIALALSGIPGLDVDAVIARIDSDQVRAEYEADRALARTAGGGATEFQGKARQTDGPVRFSAPSLVFESDGRRMEAGGFQTIEAYDVVIANMDPSLHREAAPESPLPVLERFPGGLVTAELAAIMAGHNEPPDRAATEAALIGLVGEGAARRTQVGDDAVWQPVDAVPFSLLAA